MHNRNVLSHVYHSRCNPVISADVLKHLGFLPDYHTHVMQLKNGLELKMYYDYGCLIKNAQTIRIYNPPKSKSLLKWYDKISNNHQEV